MATSATHMTPQQLTEIRQRVEAASPGPWYACTNHTKAEWLIKNEERQAFPTWIASFSIRGNGGVYNADFCAHARQDIPALLQYCEELENQLSARPVSVSCRDHVWAPMSKRIKGLEAKLKVATEALQGIVEYTPVESRDGKINELKACAHVFEIQRFALKATATLHQLTAKEGKEV